MLFTIRPIRLLPLFSMSTCRRTLSNATMGCLIILSVSYAGLGCSSLHKDAEILMEGEEYAEAAKVYTSILELGFKLLTQRGD